MAKRRKPIKKKRRRLPNRDWDDPKYVAWRAAIRKRDKYTCQMPNCGSKERLQTHHIKRWADNPTQRFSLKNGITLCKNCHDKIQGDEKKYEAKFMRILNGNSVVTIRRILHEQEESET